MGTAIKSGTTAAEAGRALHEMKRAARVLFIKIYNFRPADSDLKALLDAQNRNSDLRRRQTWQELHALLLAQQQYLQQQREAARSRWEERAHQWTQWLAEFQQALQAQAATRERNLGVSHLPVSRRPWQVLGLDPATATDAEIKRAYRRLALEHHPDRGGCVERFLEIRQAYEQLTAATG